MKRILVNATQQEELRVAIVDGQKLYNLDIEAAGKKQKKGNIYKGVISSIAPSLNAVFVDYGGARHGFLSTKEISSQYFNAEFKGSIRNQAVHKFVTEGQELIVQIVREERENKGASISTFISLTGQYLVMLPYRSRTHGISQRISGTDRKRMLDISRQLDSHADEGIILRTACLNAKKEDLHRNLKYLRSLWKQIQNAANERRAPFLIYKEANIVLQTIQNNLGEDIQEIVIDNQEIYEETKEFLSLVLPHYKKKLKLYNDNTPLFNRMHIETQIESLYQHRINLPSGGSIVLDHTEALTTIDINSARSTQQSDLEETALATNLEAADEIARQLRLRDLGGLLVIDFIDMLSRTNKRKVEDHLQELLEKDRARTRIGSISKFGLFEMSRQRLRPSLKDASEILCPRCCGRGFIRTVRSCALVVLRLIEEEAGKNGTTQIVGHVPEEIYKFLDREKQPELDNIEKCYAVKVSIVSDSQMETPHYKIMRHRKNNTIGYGKYDQESVIVRSSLYQEESADKQNGTAAMDKDERPVLPTVVTMEKATLTDISKNLWQKLTGIFSRDKDTSNEKSRKKYTRKRNHSSQRSRRSSRDGQNRKKTKQTRKTKDKNVGYRKSSTREQTIQPGKSSGKQNRSTTKVNPTKNSTRSDRTKRPYRSPRKPTRRNQSQDASQSGPQRTNQPDTRKLSTETLPKDVKNHPPAAMQKPAASTTSVNAPKQPLLNRGKSKLVQIETKRKNDSTSQ